MTRPQRIQRKARPGWRMPANTVYVGRPTKWGNPNTIAHFGGQAPLVRLSATCGPPSMVWLKSKNPASPAVRREREEDCRGFIQNCR